MYANLYGDFVKGRNLSNYPKIIQDGIELHREIDHYIDHHPAVRDLMHQLYSSLPKVASIAVDLFFDHILANEWSDYREDSLESFNQNFYKFDPNTIYTFSDEFLYMIMRMRNSDWLSGYKSLKGLEYACKGVSQRINFPNHLKYGSVVFVENEQIIKDAFHLFMKDAIPHFKSFHEDK